MPTVPRLNPQIPQTQALPNVRVNTNAPIEAFGGGAAQAQVTQAGVNALGGMAKVIQEEKQKADDLATTEAWVKLNQRKNHLFWDTKEGAMNRRGKDSFGVIDEYGQRFDKDADEIESTLSSQSQKDMFKKMRMKERLEFDGHLQKHVFQESKAFDNETTESGLKVARDDAVLNFQNPGKVQDAIKIQQSLIHAHADRNGLPAEWVKLKMTEASSKTHGAVVERMLANGDDRQASAYYQQALDQISGDDRKNLEKALEEGSSRGQSMRNADAFWAKSGGDVQAALAQARKIGDEKVRTLTEQKIRQRHSDENMAKESSSKNLFRELYNEASQSLELPDPARFSMLEPSQQEMIKNHIQKKKSGSDYTTDWGEFYSLRRMAADPETKAEFMNIDLHSMYRSSMADSEFNKLIDLQTAVKNGDAKKLKELDGVQSHYQIVSSAMKSANIDPSPKKGSKDATRSKQFWGQVEAQVNEYQDRTKKKIDNDELRKITDRLTIEHVTEKGRFWDTKKRAADLVPEDFDVSEIPAEDVRKITEALKATGQQVSDRTISEWYINKLRRK